MEKFISSLLTLKEMHIYTYLPIKLMELSRKTAWRAKEDQ